MPVSEVQNVSSMRAEIVRRWREKGGKTGIKPKEAWVVHVDPEELQALLEELPPEERYENSATGEFLLPVSMVFGVLSYIVVRVKKIEYAS